MGSSIYKPGGTPLPKLSQSKSKKRVPGQVSSSFMRARNEAAKTAQSKGRKALLKEISEILPHIKYSTLERQNEQFQQQQQQRIRNKEFVELHKREMKRLVKASEEKLALSSDEARKKACNAAACLEWEVHADVYAQHLKHYQKERALAQWDTRQRGRRVGRTQEGRPDGRAARGGRAARNSESSRQTPVRSFRRS